MSRSHASHAELMLAADQAAAHNRWLAAESQDAIVDPHPSLSFDEVMAAMDAEINAVERERAADRP
jgi:hypothetical protein